MKDRHLKAGQQDDHFILLSIHLDGLPQQGFLRHSLKERGTLVFLLFYLLTTISFITISQSEAQPKKRDSLKFYFCS